MNIIRNLPTPISGLALGSVALGNLLQAYSPTFQLIFSILSLIIIVLLTIKFIDNLKSLIEEMKKPVIATVLATYPMSIMLLSSFFKKYIVYPLGLLEFVSMFVLFVMLFTILLLKKDILKIFIQLGL